MRDHIRALVTAGVEVRIAKQQVCADPIQLDPWWKDHVEEMLQPASLDSIAMHYVIAEMYKPIKDRYNIGFTYWEISRINDYWVEQMMYMNEIWSACQFALDVFKDSGVDRPMFCAGWPFFWRVDLRRICQRLSRTPGKTGADRNRR